MDWTLQACWELQCHFWQRASLSSGAGKPLPSGALALDPFVNWSCPALLQLGHASGNLQPQLFGYSDTQAPSCLSTQRLALTSLPC